jgi:hypothetical protein
MVKQRKAEDLGEALEVEDRQYVVTLTVINNCNYLSCKTITNNYKR